MFRDDDEKRRFERLLRATFYEWCEKWLYHGLLLAIFLLAIIFAR